MLVVLLAACASRVARERIDATAGTPDAMVATHLRAVVHDLWSIPGKPDHSLVFASPPSVEGQPYGPRIYVIRNRAGSIDVLHTGRPMMDADFLDPAFFGDDRSVLLLADYGSEDSWGILAIHIGETGIRDLGEIPVMRPEGDAGYTESAIPAARVFLENGRYVVTFDGEILDADDAGRDKRFAKSGQRAVFVEEGNTFRFAGTE